ncbi:MAG: hypothetical protein WBD36_10775 [Bacteroidota bacterium]
MGAMFDYAFSTIVFGVLVFTVARIQININSTLYQNTQTIITQDNAVELARQFEYDFLKIGHKISGQKLFYADTNRIDFKTCLLNNNTVYTISYTTGTTSASAWSNNPNDFPIIRSSIDAVNGTFIAPRQYGVVEFKLFYYDSINGLLATPMTTAAQLAYVRAIKIKFRFESFEPVITATDTVWAGVTWEKLLFPRNLNNLYY